LRKAIRGSEKSISADSVVIYADLKPQKDEALQFSGSASRFLTIGDCSEMQRILRCVSDLAHYAL